MKVKFQERELCAVTPEDFHWGDKQIACSVLFDLEDGAEVIRVEISENEVSPSKGTIAQEYLCHLIIVNKSYNIRLASNARACAKHKAISTAFGKAKIAIADPALEKFNSVPTYAYRITPVMEAIAEELGVKRYAMFNEGSEPLR